MTDRDALLRAIAANPDEDTPRLVYADLLDEIGGEVNLARARFIRLQIDLVQNPGRSWFANSDRLSEVARLAGLFADRWLKELPGWARGRAQQQRLRSDDFSRGFLTTLLIKPKVFARQGNELFDVAPITRLVASNVTKRTDLTAFLSSPLLLHIRSLSMPSSAGDLVASIIQTSWRALARVEELDLSNSRLTDVGAISLAQASLPNLRVLTVRANLLTQTGATRLLSTRNLPKLELLDIRGVPGAYRWADPLRPQFPGKQILDY